MMGLVINNYLFRRNNIQQQSLKTLGHSVPTPRTAPSARASSPNSWWDFQSCNTSDSCPPHSPLSRPTSPGHIIYMDLGRSLLPDLTPSRKKFLLSSFVNRCLEQMERARSHKMICSTRSETETYGRQGPKRIIRSGELHMCIYVAFLLPVLYIF